MVDKGFDFNFVVTIRKGVCKIKVWPRPVGVKMEKITEYTTAILCTFPLYPPLHKSPNLPRCITMQIHSSFQRLSNMALVCLPCQPGQVNFWQSEMFFYLLLQNGLG
uniref:Uncharacterized protein n=1 Tax=Cacopsylla melanoneura TaxID=428564 RepID=A0A8D8R129_9HEMI